MTNLINPEISILSERFKITSELLRLIKKNALPEVHQSLSAIVARRRKGQSTRIHVISILNQFGYDFMNQPFVVRWNSCMRIAAHSSRSNGTCLLTDVVSGCDQYFIDHMPVAKITAMGKDIYFCIRFIDSHGLIMAGRFNDDEPYELDVLEESDVDVHLKVLLDILLTRVADTTVPISYLYDARRILLMIADCAAHKSAEV